MTNGSANGGTDPLIGQAIGEFWVVNKLAEGGMGAVYLLHHRSFPGIRKVLKVILQKFADAGFVRDRFLAEADAMAQLGSHPNIVGIDNVLTLPNGQLGILIPFVDGVPLDKYLDDYFQQHAEGLPAHRAMHIIAHVGRALHHAHTHNVVHRDLKPGNVFVQIDDNDGVFCKLLDFGIARRMTPNPHIPSNTSFGPLGTPHFMAPEQHERAAEATPAADVFALACMIWLMITRGLPWGDPEDASVLYHRKLNVQPDPPLGRGLSPEWEDILRAALRPDPGVRPSLGQLMRALGSTLPAIGRLVPSGTEILQRYARCFIEESAPDDTTLRNSSNRTLMPAWPERDNSIRSVPTSVPNIAHAVSQPANPNQPVARYDQPPVAMRGASSSWSPSGMQLGPMASGASAPPVSAAASAPVGIGAPHLMVTTLGASTGAVGSPIAKSGRWKLALLGVAATVIASGGTLVVVGTQRHGASQPSSMSPPSSLTTSSPSAPPVAGSAPPAPTASSSPPAVSSAPPPPAGSAPSSASATSPSPAASSPPSAAASAIASSPLPAASSPPPTAASASVSAPASSAPRAASSSPPGTKPTQSLVPAKPVAVPSGARRSAKPTSPGTDHQTPDPPHAQKFDPNGVIGGQEN